MSETYVLMGPNVELFHVTRIHFQKIKRGKFNKKML